MTMAGWDCTPEGSFDDCSVLLLAVSREAQGGTYQVAIVNTGDGSEYHPSVVVPPAAEMRQVSPPPLPSLFLFLLAATRPINVALVIWR